MIDLALLCNLYADGPTTLGRLRELGCESLDEVEALAGADLGWALQTDADACERFRREACLLRERRSGPSAASDASAATARPVSENGGDGPPPHAAHAESDSARHAHAGPGRGGSELDEPAGEVPSDQPRDASRAERSGDCPVGSGQDEAGRREGSLLDVLLRAWRRASGRGDEEADAPDQDQREPQVDVPRPAAPAARTSDVGAERPSERARGLAEPMSWAASSSADPVADPDRASDSERRADDRPVRETASIARDAAHPSAPVEPGDARGDARGDAPSAERTNPAAQRPSVPRTTTTRGTALRDVGFEGVEADYAEQLEKLGIATVEDFLAAQPLDLAGRSSMRYTVLLRMQFMARRELQRSS